MAELELHENHPEQALHRLQPLITGAQSGESQVFYLVPLLALAHLQVGDHERCEELLAPAVELSRKDNVRPVLAEALFVRGKMLTRQRRWQDSEEAFEEALSLARAMPFPQAEARTLYEYGLMLQLAGRVEDARGNLSAALAIFQRLGARKDAEQTESTLNSL